MGSPDNRDQLLKLAVQMPAYVLLGFVLYGGYSLLRDRVAHMAETDSRMAVAMERVALAIEDAAKEYKYEHGSNSEDSSVPGVTDRITGMSLSEEQ
jgi:hypothetical protein